MTEARQKMLRKQSVYANTLALRDHFFNDVSE